MGDLVSIAVDLANEKWGDGRDMAPERWLAVLVEEVGEVARAVIERDYDEQLDAELAQVAAVAIRWIEARR